MTDPKSILDALQALKVATDIVKALRAADVSFEKAELKLKIAEVATALADARLGILDAQEEIVSLKRRIAELEMAQGVRDRIMRRANAYFLRDGDTEKGPYCSRCFEAGQKLMPLSELPAAFRDVAKYTCPQCKAHY